MSEGLNRATLLGNLGADPEVRSTQSGTTVMSLSLATTTRVKNRDGEWQDVTDWHRVVVWGRRAEGLSRFLRKGSRVYVEGALKTSSYEKDGVKRYKTEVSAEQILLLGQGTGRDDHRQADTKRAANQPDREPSIDDDDIPF